MNFISRGQVTIYEAYLPFSGEKLLEAIGDVEPEPFFPNLPYELNKGINPPVWVHTPPGAGSYTATLFLRYEIAAMIAPLNWRGYVARGSYAGMDGTWLLLQDGDRFVDPPYYR